MVSTYSRNSQLPVEPGLPIPQEDTNRWLSTFTGRVYWWIKTLANSTNLLIQGYLYTVTALATAAQKYRGQLIVLQGGGATPDKLYLCVYDGVAYSWKPVTVSDVSGIVTSYRSTQMNFGLGSAVSSLAITLSPVEADTNYIVVAESTWNTSAWLSVKTTSGYTIQFGTATPDANQKITTGLLRAG